MPVETDYRLEKVQGTPAVSKLLQVDVNNDVHISVKKIDNGYILRYEMYDTLGAQNTDIVKEVFHKEAPSIVVNSVK